MSEHVHLVRYTITMRQRRFWGARVTLTVLGTGSSKKENEILIFQEGGGFQSINYDHVLRVVAEPLAP